MSLRLEIKKKMMERSPRVKAIDFHHQNTWVVFGLYSGTLALHDYSNNVIFFLERLAFGLLKHQPTQYELLSLSVISIG
jgi:hypothetical protein